MIGYSGLPSAHSFLPFQSIWLTIDSYSNFLVSRGWVFWPIFPSFDKDAAMIGSSHPHSIGI